MWTTGATILAIALGVSAIFDMWRFLLMLSDRQQRKRRQVTKHTVVEVDENSEV